MEPSVSVAILAYNAEKFLSEAIDSVLRQSLSSYELIIIDDGSTDETAAILARYQAQNPRIRVHANAENLGISKSRNIALKLARGKYIAWLDSDDIATPDRLAQQVQFMESHPDYGLISSDTEIIDEDSKRVGRRVYPHTDDEIRQVLTRYNPFAQPASMLRRELIERVGAYREDLECVEDYELFLRIASRTKVANIASPLTEYRISTGQSKARLLKQTIRNTLRVQQMTRGLGFPDPWQNKSYRVFLRLLALLPNGLILWLFKKSTYARVTSGRP